VFGADESGHRYTQPVFADLDPHHFTMEAHEPTPPPPGELIITPDTLWFEQMGENREFVIKNETAEAVTIQSIIPEAGSALNIWELNLPYTLQTNDSVTVVVNLQTPPLKEEYIAYNIKINTTIGQRTVVAMVLNESYDIGLYIPGSPFVELTVNEPQAEVYVTNGNYGTHTPIKITAITEAENQWLHDLLELTHHDLPYVLEAGENFMITIAPRTDFGNKQDQIHTSILVVSNDNDVVFDIVIDEELVSVTELSAEIKLYPNPTTGLFTVEGANMSKVEVFNLVGQKVHEAEGQSVNIDAAGWNKGIYLVNIVERNGAVVTKKLVVK
jgi:hypothetical protein